MSVFCVFVFFHLSSIFNLKTSEVKIPLTICRLLCYFHGNILRLHKELRILKLRRQKSTWWSTDSAVWCTPWSLTPWWDANRGVFEIFCFLDSAVWCTLWSLTPQYDAHCGVSLTFEFENTLACLSGAQMGSKHEKKEVKISWHTPFKHHDEKYQLCAKVQVDWGCSSTRT